MSVKLLSFRKDKNAKAPVAAGPLALDSKGSKSTQEGEVIDHGDMVSQAGTLKYEIYKRGLIKIWRQGDAGCFKKDINLFETELLKTDFDSLAEGQEVILKGSGDNDHLVFSKVNGDIVITIKKREFAAIELLQKVLSKGKQKLISASKGA